MFFLHALGLCGTSTPISNLAHAATNVRFENKMHCIALKDGREIGAPKSRFPWLEEATPAHRAQWHIEQYGFAVYWEELDDEIEAGQLVE